MSSRMNNNSVLSQSKMNMTSNNILNSSININEINYYDDFISNNNS